MPHKLEQLQILYERVLGATRELAPPGTGSAPPPPPSMAGKIHTSSTSSSGRYRAHVPAHILTDTTNRYPCLGDSVQNCCPGLEPSPGLLPTLQPLAGHTCTHSTTLPGRAPTNREPGCPAAAPRSHPRTSPAPLRSAAVPLLTVLLRLLPATPQVLCWNCTYYFGLA